jgi:hypothetical protein
VVNRLVRQQNRHRALYSFGQTVQIQSTYTGTPKISEQPCAYHGTGHDIEDDPAIMLAHDLARVEPCQQSADNPCQKVVGRLLALEGFNREPQCS